MYDALKFCQGAIAKKEIIEGLSHFKIEDGTVRSFNGVVALCSPINVDFNCTPKAVPMIKAIQNCSNDVQLTMTASGRLSIKSGSFKVFINCLSDEVTPHVQPEGDIYPIDGEKTINAIKTLIKFVGTDFTRMFCTGVRLKDQYAYATNNVIVVQHWMQATFPLDINIPSVALNEIIRIKEYPISIQANNDSITFHYESGRWLRCATLVNTWPNVEKILDVPSNALPIDNSIFEAIEAILPFADSNGRMFIENGVIRTHMEATEGASYNIKDYNAVGIYAMTMFKLLHNVAKHIDLTTYPKPCVFYGDNLRGSIIGFKPL